MSAFHSRGGLVASKCARRRFVLSAAAASCAGLALVESARADLSAVQYSAGTTYSQNFNGMPTSGGAVVFGAATQSLTAFDLSTSYSTANVTGWQFGKIGGSTTQGAPAVFSGTSSSNSGRMYNWGNETRASFVGPLTD